jgi:hypothetical protein
MELRDRLELELLVLQAQPDPLELEKQGLRDRLELE